MSRIFLPLACLLTATAGAQENLMRVVHDTATDTHVEVLALFTNPAPCGYLPVRVTIANNQNRSHRIDLRSEIGGLYSGGGLKGSAAFSIKADAGQVVTRDLLIPTLPGVHNHTYGSQLSIYLSGTMGSTQHGDHLEHGSSTPQVLLSHRLHTVNASQIDQAGASRFHSGYGGSREMTSRFDAKQLPADWLAYGGYDWMVVTDEEWADIPPAQRNAILSWVRLGGNLNIRHRMERFDRARLGLPDDAGFGTITAAPIAAELTMDAEQFVRGLVTSSVLPPRGASLTEDFDGKWPLQADFGSKNFQFAIFIFVLIIFMVVVGPVNLFLLAPSGRRHRLFLTTPLISLGASLFMVGIIIFQDGFGGDGARVVLMEVRPDEGRHAAFIHQEQFARTGILTRTSFSVPTPALFHPVPIAQTRWTRFTNRNNADGSYNVQPGGSSLAATGDWFQSRSEQGQFITTVVPSRGRIEANGDGWVHTFPQRIDFLFLRDQNGEWHVAEGLATGERFAVKKIPAAEARDRLDKEAAALFTPRLKAMLNRAILRDNHFVAITSAAPGIATHPGIHWKTTRTVMTGPLVR
jgi:hypothetical protein